MRTKQTENKAARVIDHDAISTLQAIVQLIGNVDHSKGNGGNAAQMRGELLNDIRTMAMAAVKLIWQPIATVSKDDLWESDGHRHGKRIVAYDPHSGRILTCHWWESDKGGRHASNFLDDGGNAVFPSKWINIGLPEESDD
jgi:hypothetical protein